MFTYIISMAQAAHVPKLKYAKIGANPTLETIEYVMDILKSNDMPISRNFILKTLHEWKHSTTRQSLNAAISFLGDGGMIAEGKKGLIWVPEAPSQLLETIQKGKRL